MWFDNKDGKMEMMRHHLTIRKEMKRRDLATVDSISLPGYCHWAGGNEERTLSLLRFISPIQGLNCWPSERLWLCLKKAINCKSVTGFKLCSPARKSDALHGHPPAWPPQPYSLPVYINALYFLHQHWTFIGCKFRPAELFNMSSFLDTELAWWLE